MAAMVSAISPRQGLAAQPLKGEVHHAEAPAAPPASTALVPVAPVQSATGSRHAPLRPDPSFVMHLIATATHAPQTRRLRQATASDGIAQYTATRVAVQPRAASGLQFKDMA
jgi:hypothetical protein